MPEPVERIEWRLAEELQANDYNPNAVHRQELLLLERSILLTGWVQPIMISAEGVIIDGFHRALLARSSPALLARYGGRVPCVTVPVSRGDAMVMTIRMNRAKGTHVALRMSAIVRELVNVLHYDPAEVAVEIGATKQEVDLLLQEGVFALKSSEKHTYSQAWYPEETGAAN